VAFYFQAIDLAINMPTCFVGIIFLKQAISAISAQKKEPEVIEPWRIRTQPSDFEDMHAPDGKTIIGRGTSKDIAEDNGE